MPPAGPCLASSATGFGLALQKLVRMLALGQGLKLLRPMDLALQSAMGRSLAAVNQLGLQLLRRLLLAAVSIARQCYLGRIQASQAELHRIEFRFCVWETTLERLQQL